MPTSAGCSAGRSRPAANNRPIYSREGASMAFSKLVLVAAAVFGSVIIAAAALAVMFAPIDRDAVGAVFASPRETEAIAGQHGGTVLKQGDLSVEIVLAEKPGDARLVAYLF